MVKTNVTIKMENDLWEEAGEKYDNKSKKVRELLREDLDKEPEKPESIKLFDKTGLTPKQEKLAKRVVKSDLPIKRDKIGKIGRENNLYTRKDHIRNAVKAMIELDSVPIMFEQGKVRPKQFQCVCDAKINVKALKSDRVTDEWCCPKCGIKYEV